MSQQFRASSRLCFQQLIKLSNMLQHPHDIITVTIDDESIIQVSADVEYLDFLAQTRLALKLQVDERARFHWLTKNSDRNTLSNQPELKEAIRSSLRSSNVYPQLKLIVHIETVMINLPLNQLPPIIEEDKRDLEGYMLLPGECTRAELDSFGNEFFTELDSYESPMPYAVRFPIRLGSHSTDHECEHLLTNEVNARVLEDLEHNFKCGDEKPLVVDWDLSWVEFDNHRRSISVQTSPQLVDAWSQHTVGEHLLESTKMYDTVQFTSSIQDDDDEETLHNVYETSDDCKTLFNEQDPREPTLMSPSATSFMLSSFPKGSTMTLSLRMASCVSAQSQVELLLSPIDNESNQDMYEDEMDWEIVEEVLMEGIAV